MLIHLSQSGIQRFSRQRCYILCVLAVRDLCICFCAVSVEYIMLSAAYEICILRRTDFLVCPIYFLVDAFYAV